MKQNGESDVHQAVRDLPLIQHAMREAVQDAIRTHKLLGHEIVIWRDNRVVIVPPEQIDLNEAAPRSNGKSQGL